MSLEVIVFGDELFLTITDLVVGRLGMIVAEIASC
jgi:hypothetical protein